MQLKPNIQQFFEQLRALPFVTDLDFSAEGHRNDREAEDILKIRAPKGTYRFLVEQKRSYLDRGMLNARVAQAKLYATEHRVPLLLFARYIPGPSAERLMQSGINFVDQAGNMHLVLGRNYERTVVGRNKRHPGTKIRVSVRPSRNCYSLSPLRKMPETGPYANWPNLPGSARAISRR
jgi:hypothetical protein